MDPECLTANFKIQKGFWTIVKDPYFLFELFLLLLIPYPIEAGGQGIFKNLSATFQTSAINWTMGDVLHG